MNEKNVKSTQHLLLLSITKHKARNRHKRIWNVVFVLNQKLDTTAWGGWDPSMHDIGYISIWIEETASVE